MELEQETINIISSNLRTDSKTFVSSSFQTQSLPLLHIISKNFPLINVVFIDTGFLFPETYAFKDILINKFDLKVITVSSSKNYLHQKTENGLFTYAKNTDYCCLINKVEPIESVIKSGDVWISGVRRDQSKVRNEMLEKEEDSRGVIRIHPMLNWSTKDIYDYIKKHDLPKHPLENDGYVSIGCVPCTHKWNNDLTRGGRWIGQQKTECGLHTERKK